MKIHSTPSLLSVLKRLALMASVPVLAAACLGDDDSYSAGFPVLSTSSEYFYANNTADTLFLLSYGDWQLTKKTANDWCQLESQRGSGNQYYVLPFSMTLNTTGQARRSAYHLADIAHSDTYVDWDFLQLATRGNGALGSAALVSTIQGSDGSDVSISYDQLARPTALRVKKGDATLHDLSISYNDAARRMTVGNGRAEMTSGYNNSYEAQTLLSATDTVLLRMQQEYNMYTREGMAFNLEEHLAGGDYRVSALLISHINAYPDSLHTADSLRFQQRTNGVVETQRFKLGYTAHDNRCQSVDVNALLLGIDRMDPYALLALFPYTRSSYVLSQATTADPSDAITVAADYNADGSVAQLTVERRGERVTYTFKYAN